MLVDTQYIKSKNNLIVSYVDRSGNIKFKNYHWPNPKKYVNCDPTDKDRHPKYHSWDGKPVKQIEVENPDRYAIYEFLDGLPEKEKDVIFEYNLPKIYFIDIETEIVDGFPDAETAPTQVLSISIVYDDKIILLGLKELSDQTQKKIIDNTNEYFKNYKVNYKLKYIKYDCEFDLMYSFFYKMVPQMPLLTGWNFLNYDWLYLVNRARKLKKFVNGQEIIIDPAISSPTKRMNKVWMSEQEIPQHRMIFDYMQLYEIADTSIKVKESSSLDFVSSKLVGTEKIKYTGSLQKLYEDDFETFMYYNAVDSVLVQKIHEVRNYISIIFAISSLAKIKVVDVISQVNNALGSLAITEGVLRNRFRESENIVLFRSEKSNGESAGLAGGWVKDPVVGMNKWCVTYDFASLYPTTQRQFYIAPETYVGKKDTKNPEYCDNGVKIELDKHVVCVNDVVFEKRNSPTLKMLEDVYADRKKNKKIMMAKKEELKEVLDQIKQLEAELE
jgi:DNA polymerase elongation subunit (family B)